MHYLNQFFVGIGGEEKADVPVGSREGTVGPGKRLQDLLGDSAKIVTTVYCGDNYFAEHSDEALASTLRIAKDQDVKIVVAGPAFQAGRYGFACAEVMHYLRTSLDLYCVGGTHIENPAVATYKQYKDRCLLVCS
jgi:glycine reductase